MNAELTTKDLQKSYEEARQVTRHHAKSFYFSSFPLPRQKRLRAYAIYAFCRHCDDWIDSAPPGSRLDAVDQLGDFTRNLYNARLSKVPAWGAAFHDTITQCSVPQSLCLDLIHGVCLDASGSIKIQDWEELKNYCYYVASVVGLLMNCVFEPGNREAAEGPAIDLGIAMQLTNILRDVREDAAIGRVYLPQNELNAHGLSEANFQDPEIYLSSEWNQYAAFFAQRAQEHYKNAEHGIALLPDDGSRYCVRCMSRIYSAILQKIAGADWDVSKRQFVPLIQKIFLAWQARKT